LRVELVPYVEQVVQLRVEGILGRDALKILIKEAIEVLDSHFRLHLLLSVDLLEQLLLPHLVDVFVLDLERYSHVATHVGLYTEVERVGPLIQLIHITSSS
jgi:hypothetical protein